MGEVLSYVKVNLRTMIFVILGDETRKKRIRNGILLFIIFITSVEYSLIKSFNSFTVFGGEILVFNFILNIQIIFIISLIFSSILSKVFLESDWKEMMVYPIKSGSLLVVKCILTYIVSTVVTIVVLIPLFTYGMLIKAGTLYYLTVIGFQIVMSFIPTIYLVLVPLTVSWAISSIKGTKYTHKNNKWFMLVILAVVGLTYLLVKDIPNGKIGSLLNNIFFNSNPSLLISSEVLTKFIIASAIILIFSFGIYLTGGEVYMKVMKSGIFTSNNSKKVEFILENYEFKINSPVMSNVIRDIKLMIRVPIMRSSCIITNLVISMAILIFALFFKDEVVLIGSKVELKGTLIVVFFMTLASMNMTLMTSFSREGRALSQYKIYPIVDKSLLMSKIIVGVISNVFIFICLTIIIAIMSTSIIDFILHELLLVVCTIGVTIIFIKTDLGSMEAKWVDIKELFGSMHIAKAIIPGYILMFFSFLAFVPGMIFSKFNIEVSDYFTVILIIAIMVIYSSLSYKKIKKNMI